MVRATAQGGSLLSLAVGSFLAYQGHLVGAALTTNLLQKAQATQEGQWENPATGHEG